MRTPFLVSAILNSIYQLITHGFIYPLELLFTATLLALVPYLVLRGPANRVAAQFISASGKPEGSALTPHDNSSLRDHRQNKSNIVIEALGRSSCSQEIDDALDGGVGAVIGGFEPAFWTVLRVGSVMEAAVGEGAAQALVEEEEEQGDLDALG